ncbi:leucine/isoleucine/valine transporter permease subunit [Nonomuraea coxensis DSM 45129]|uniref:Leucine/isoleucine/valine transporter permease subunit n=1 Tax=Nonomuraea coxensis DSM 45129 TaxID=1122611 RepID=A0ABX8U3Z1_9ACTN|nr:branched-chain amino acid ABC transporter permease [Nonomuraea coxensis]QYC42435.1 leucine/isoleucine/valine transporter permease subunit [Nonomuraea coxensis DSM 45129]
MTGVLGASTAGHRRTAVGLTAGDRRRTWPWRRTALAMIVVVAAGLPFVLPPYRLFQVTLVLVYVVALLGLDLVVGHSGQISLGHGAFFGVGAYVAAVMIGRLGVPYPVTLPVAALVTYGLGWAAGLPALRLRGLYLAMVTFSVAVVLPPLLKRFPEVTGGAMGMPVATPRGIGMDDDQWIYFLVLATAAVAVAGIRNLTRSRGGRALTAIRQHPAAAEVLGMRAAGHLTRAFAWSAMYAGAAGALYTWTTGFVAPDTFTLSLSITLLAGAVIGGLATPAGPLLGALVVTAVPAAARELNPAAPGLVSGLLIVVVIYAAPTGLAGLLRRAAAAVTGRLRARRRA